MKKNRLKNYLKLGVILFGVSLLLTTCEREDADFMERSPSEQSVKKGYTVKSVSLEAVKKNELIKNSLDVIASQFDFNKTTETSTSKNQGNYTTSALADPIKSKDNSFTILTDEIIEIITDNFESYTFKIETPTDESSVFENFTIEKNKENQYTYYINRYTNAINSENLEFKYNISRQSVSENQINIGDFDSIFSIADTTPVITSLYVCVETRIWRACSLGGPHGNGTQCNSGWDTSRTCSWLPGHNGTGGPGSTPETDTSENSRGGGTSTENDASSIYVAPIIPTPLELETAAFFENLTDEENECLDEGFGQFKNDIKNFFKNNQETNCTGTSIQNPGINDNDIAGVIPSCVKEFAENAVDAFCDGGEVDFVNEVILDESFVSNEKLKCVYDKLTLDNSPLFKNTIGAFIDDPEFKLTFKVGNCTNTDDACTNDDDPNNIVIIIEDINITPVEMAQFILHEAIHAEIARYVAQYQSGVDVNDRPYLFELYKHYKELYDSGDIDHIYMTLNYINPINAALREFDDNNFPSNYYGSFAWDGLRIWDAGDLLSTEEDAANALRRIEVIENSSVCE